MHLGFGEDWINSIDTSRYMLPYLFPALAVSPLTVIELIFDHTDISCVFSWNNWQSY